MIIEPKLRGFICTTAHPTGCDENVRQQIKYVKKKGAIPNTPKRVLVIGASTGYGLASRIAAAFGFGAGTVGVSFERPGSEGRCASAGWYNTAAFTKYAKAEGLVCENIIGDAFSWEIKEKTIDTIKSTLGKVDLVIYSVASPRRCAPDGITYSSSLKPIGEVYTNKSINTATNEVNEVSLSPASEKEIADTVKVMGGEDWELWMHALNDAGVLSEGAVTLAYSYIGPALTHPIYTNGTIGQAKRDLEITAARMNGELDIHALVSVNKALVTQSSAAIPVVPLYISILFKLMHEKGTFEGTIEQMYRLFSDKLYIGGEAFAPVVDAEGRLRVDDYEMEPSLQAEISRVWDIVTTDNLAEYANLDEYKSEFLRLFGFGIEGVDYSADVATEIDF